MRPATLLRLALAGTRTDTLRVGLTAFSAALAALAALCALTVLAIDPPGRPGAGQPGWADQYRSALLREPGLRPGVAFTFLLMTIPVLALAGQCARVGAPARDRRLAAVRLAGATPRQAMGIAVAETGLAALTGTLAGLGGYFLLRTSLHAPGPQGRLPLPTDVLPSPGAMGAVVLGMPLLAALAGGLMLRRVNTSPLDVDRRSRRRRGPPRLWPGALLVSGLTVAATATPVLKWYARTGGHPFPDRTVPTVLALGALSVVLGVVLGTGWVSHTAGRLLLRFARRPAPLLAARRLLADPWNGSRTFAALLTCLVFASGAAAVRALFVARREALVERRRLFEAATAGPDDSPPVRLDGFYVGTTDLVEGAVLVAMLVAVLGLFVAIADGVAARRRVHAALTASGVPRGVLGRALAWQTLLPVLPAAALALTAGTLLGRGYGTQESASASLMAQKCDGDPVVCADAEPVPGGGGMVQLPDVVREADVPWGDLALYGSLTVALVVAAVSFGSLFLRSGTSVEELRTG
jgi:hypothetical protein